MIRIIGNMESRDQKILLFSVILFRHSGSVVFSFIFANP